MFTNYGISAINEQEPEALFNLIKDENKFLIDTLKWNGLAKKVGMETGDIISEFKVENLNRPNKSIVYPIAFVLIIIFGYFNYRRKDS